MNIDPKNIISDEKIANLVQQHLIVDLLCTDIGDTNESGSQGQEAIPIPYHLPGTAITHDIYAHTNILLATQSLQRTQSSGDLRSSAPEAAQESEFEYLAKPGGFRRFHVQQQQQQQQQEQEGLPLSESNEAFTELLRPDSKTSLHSYSATFSNEPPGKPTRHFLEWLAGTSVFDRFAGEDLMDTEDEEGERDEEQAPLLNHRKSKKSKTTNEQVIHKTGSLKAGFLLFKAFIGSGILFLPKAFSNGGLGFSIFFMWFMGVISLYCFLLLLECKRYLPGSYGDIGGAIYGPWMRHLVLFSIAVSQLGFVCGGTIFIVKNISAAVYSLSRETVLLPPTSVLLSVTLLLVPLVLIRNIAKLSPTALLSDVLIIAGLLIVVGYDLQTIFSSASVGFSPSTVGPDINWWFNPAECSVFIGTAVYSFEGIGLIIPIRDSMQSPEKFPKVLSFVMALVASVLCLIGALGYIAFGSDVETVVLLNLPSGTLTSSVQLSYAFAIHLSNALTIFPTVRILEQALFGERTGKNNTMVKWQKNGLRCAVVAVIAVVAKAGASDLDKFVSLIGSICCCPLSLIFPPLFHLKLNKPENSLVKLADILLIIFGIIIMLFTLWSTSSRWITMG